MKKFLVLTVMFLLYVDYSYSQDEMVCGAISSDSSLTYTATGVESLAVVLVDFPEGRKQPGNVLPTIDVDTVYFGTDSAAIDAIGSMGYEIVDGALRKRIRKYTYDNYWDWIFDSTYSGEWHPDSASHSIKNYGSLKDYYKEVSYNKLT
ncbi:MAG: hypothetical protein M0R68_10405, partial [Bacteroidetes bacterium]|nr:hypothetical protein [Bacteroidota bacterium]